MAQPRLSEVFSFKEAEEDQVDRPRSVTGQAPKAQPHPGSSMPSGMHSVKPQMAPPRGGRIGPPPKPPSKPIDPAHAFLKGQLSAKDAEVAAQKAQARRVGAATGGMDSQQMSQAAQDDPEEKGIPDANKPKYKGSFMGQQADLGGQFVRKPVSWIDKQSGERKYGGVQSKETQKAVWDGQEWLTPGQFSKKFSGGGKP